jgi:hypothetical protein
MDFNYIFLTKEQFIQSINYYNNIDYETFLNTCKIMYKKEITLNEYFENNKNKLVKDKIDIRISDFEKITKLLYNLIITNKYETNEKFFNSYLIIKKLKKNYWNKFPIFDEQNNIIIGQKNDSSKRLIRNLHYQDILEYTNITTSIPNKYTFLKTWKNMFEKLEIDDRYFTPSVLSQLLKNEPIHYFYQQYQPKASIINPYIIFYLLDYYYPNLIPNCNKTFLTPVLSWSVYAYAFTQSKFWNHYIGIDVMDNVCNKTKLLLNYYITNSDKNYDIYCYPSEKMDQLNINNKVDLIMICPPYYNMEIYETYNENNNQSITLYTNYQSWLENYLTQTLLNCNELLNNNGIFAIIIGNYREYKTQIYYNLYEDIKNIFKNKFKQYTLLNEIKIYNRLSPLRNNDKTRYEYLLNYRKQI